MPEWISRGFFKNDKTEWVLAVNCNLEDWFIGFSFYRKSHVYSVSLLCFTFLLYESHLPSVLRRLQNE